MRTGAAPGGGSGIADRDYLSAGAAVAPVDEVWRQAELILEVKEPLPEEWALLREGQIIFTYLHPAVAGALNLPYTSPGEALA